jgi:hypothetical protein
MIWAVTGIEKINTNKPKAAAWSAWFIIIGCLYLTIWSRKMEGRGSCAHDEQMLLFVIYTPPALREQRR